MDKQGLGRSVKKSSVYDTTFRIGAVRLGVRSAYDRQI
jgi:hypothetical protein